MFSIKKLGAISRTYNHLNRYHRILRVLFKYGFNDLVERLHLDRYLESGLKMINRKPREQLEKHTRPERLRMALEDLGPTFIKLGQLLSTRSDFIDLEYLEELAKLQDAVPPFPCAEAQRIIREETGKELEEIFSYFDETPLAAASIGQVHRARLHDGTELVIKVQRPDIEKIIAVDLEILAHIASLMEQYLEELRGHRPTAIVKEFARSISREIDFTREIASINRFTRQFRNNPTIYIPKAFSAYSSERVLVLEYIDGVKASKISDLKRLDYDLPLIAERGTNLVMEQIFIHGFFHADPHPGNIFILPGNVICFIDFGQMGRLSRRDREDFTDLVLDLVGGDEQRVTESVIKLTIHYGEIDRNALGLDLGDLMDRYLHLPLGEMHVGKILQDLLAIVSKHRIYFKPNMYLMIKALSTVEGVGQMLDPTLELIRVAEPFMRRIRFGRMGPRRLMEEAGETGGDYLELFRSLPDNLRVILSSLSKGQMKIAFRHSGLEGFENSLDRISNRIAFAIVLASQIIGSSLIVLSGIPPKWHDIPIVGLGGFLVAIIMGFWLLISIIRHGRM
ncbi:MAG: AarF/ABC1/UbiB kinase family protein [Desulfobulbaceae bacterium]|nr:AarF/ABC1/UbiB kinase family protein [Desulfobulbaceae bacterium]